MKILPVQGIERIRASARSVSIFYSFFSVCIPCFSIFRYNVALPIPSFSDDLERLPPHSSIVLMIICFSISSRVCDDSSAGLRILTWYLCSNKIIRFYLVTFCEQQSSFNYVFKFPDISGPGLFAKPFICFFRQ